MLKLTLGHEDTQNFRHEDAVFHLVVLQNGADRPSRRAHRGIQHVNVLRLTVSSHHVINTVTSVNEDGTRSIHETVLVKHGLV